MSGRGDFIVRWVVPGLSALCLGFGLSRILIAFVVLSNGETSAAVIAALIGVAALAANAGLMHWRSRRLGLTKPTEPAGVDDGLTAWIVAFLGHDWSQASPWPAQRRSGWFARAQRVTLSLAYALVWAWLCFGLMLVLDSSLASITRFPLQAAVGFFSGVFGLVFSIAWGGFALFLLERLLGFVGSFFGEPIAVSTSRFAELRRKHSH